MSSSRTAQSTAQTTSQQDNRVVNSYDQSNHSIDNSFHQQVFDSSNRSTDNSVSNQYTDQSATTTNYDNHSTTTDFGAVQGSMALIASGQQHQAENFSQMLDSNRSMFQSGVGFADHALQGVLHNAADTQRTTSQLLNGYSETQRQVTNSQAATLNTATGAIKDAFTTAKAGEQKIFVGAVVALIAIVALRK